MNPYIKSAKAVLKKEIEGIEALIKESLDESYIKVVDLILLTAKKEEGLYLVAWGRVVILPIN